MFSLGRMDNWNKQKKNIWKYIWMDPETDGGEILNKIYERAKIDTI